MLLPQHNSEWIEKRDSVLDDLVDEVGEALVAWRQFSTDILSFWSRIEYGYH